VADRAPWRGALEAELRAVGRELEVPPAGDLTAAVRQRLEGQAVRRLMPRRRSAAPLRRLRWRAALAALAVLAAFALVVIATPQGRAAISHVFRFGGVELRQGPTHPAASSAATSGAATSGASASGASLPGEQRMSLAQARRQVTFPILVPAALGPPNQVVVSDRGRVVTLVYLRTPYGQVRMDEFAGQVDQIYFEKIVYLGNVSQARVNGRKALWIKGPQELVYIKRDGTPAAAPPRLTTGNTLLWGTGQAALRLEGDFGETAALTIARSAR
jgi:hypothetical protein